MIPLWQVLLLLIGAYLLGSIPFGMLVARSKGIDIRKHGSGNVGATNIGRVLGKKWGVLVFLLDAGKGAVSTLAAGGLTAGVVVADADYLTRDLIWLGAALACVIGNMFSVFLRFKGGKGVATSLGALLGVYPYLTLPAVAAFFLWAIVVKMSGYISLGSILAASFLPIAFITIAAAKNWPLAHHYPLLTLLVVLAALVIYRHRTNIARLLNGTENRIGRHVDNGDA